MLRKFQTTDGATKAVVFAVAAAIIVVVSYSTIAVAATRDSSEPALIVLR